MKKTNKTGIIGSIITIVILIFLVILSNTNKEGFFKIEEFSAKIIMPIQNGLTYLKNKIANNDSFFREISELQTENTELKEKNSALEKQLRELEIIKAENMVLKEYEKLTDLYPNYTTVPAYIIDKDISNYSSILVINVGRDKGIEKNMAVIAEKGLVGHIISVSEKTSKVQVIVDPASVVSSSISTSKEGVICKGVLDKKNIMELTYIPTDAQLVQDDNIETSGLGGIYPKGIYIGRIKEIIETKNIIDRYAIIETGVDFSKLETVLVIQ